MVRTGPQMKALSDASVERLCAEQVITSLAIAVKELLENSLDAGATSIDIRMYNYGLQQIEVADNGHGISSVETFKCIYTLSATHTFTSHQ